MQFETRKIVPVRRVADQKRFDSLFPHQRTQAFAALFAHLFGHNRIRLFL